MRRGAPEGLSEVVRRRLETLLEEVPPRRVEPGDEAIADEADEARAPGLPGWLVPGLAFGRRHVVVVALVALTGFLWVGWSLFQVRTVPVAVAVVPSSPAASVGSPPAATPTASATGSVAPTASVAATMFVHVLGEVRSPGVVRLAVGARVQDAIEAAGGLTTRAAPAELNLAAVVTDGAQIIIGRRGHPRGEVRGASETGTAAGAGATTGAGRLDLNAATLAQLDTLPGVGPVTAQRILDWRLAHQRFTRVEELQEVDGIGPKTYADIAPHVRV